MPSIYEPDTYVEGQLPRISLAALDRQRIKECLLQNDGHRERTAAELGIATRTLQRRLRQFTKLDMHTGGQGYDILIVPQ